MSTLTGWMCLLLIRATHVVSQSLCGANSYLEVKEGQNSTFTCTGLTAHQTVYWLWESTLISTCTVSGCQQVLYPTRFSANRPEATYSNITVYASAFLNLDYLATTNLSCQTNDSKETCSVDVIYPAENPKCQIEFSGETWQLAGWCSVSKVRSRRYRYGCYLYQTLEGSSSVFVGIFTMSTTPIPGTNYSSIDCNITTALPPYGKYNYSVIIIPGEVQVLPSFNGSNQISRPSESPQHDCPQNVTEGENIDCLCYSENLGSPSGSLIWKGTNSSKLKIQNVNKTYSGTSHICYLMWNNTAVQNSIYTVTVNYAAKVLSFKVDGEPDDVVHVRENTNVSVGCQAEGRPLPTIRLFKTSSNNQDLELSVAYSAQELHYTMNTIQCEATAIYSCKSDNGIFGDEKFLRLIVSCFPKKVSNDSYVTTFVGDEASLVITMIAFPLPNLLSIFHIGSANNSISRKLEHEDTVRSTCSSDTSYSFMFTCTVTLLNKTVYSTGFYTVTFSNGLGNISFTFEVKERINYTTQATVSKDLENVHKNLSLAGTVAGGVIGAVVFIALIIGIVIFIVRRKRKRDENGLPKNSKSTSRTIPGKRLEKLYDELQREDINTPSTYQTLGEQQTSNDSEDHEGKSHVYETPMELHETERGKCQKETVYQNSTFS